MSTRCGFIAIIGAPNAGKSTLINSILGKKVAIVTPKVQTTRINMRGILTRGDIQYIFVDTPGIHEPKRKLDKSMVTAAHQAWMEADAVVLLVDAKAGFRDGVLQIIDVVKESKAPVLLAFNKVDELHKEKLLPLMQQAQDMDVFQDIFAISAKTGSGVPDVLKKLAVYLPESPYLYDEETLTDMPMRLLAAEITREKAFLSLQQEIPYALAVETVSYEERDKKGDVVIRQNILIERDSQKKIVLGKGGAVLKIIGAKSRKDLEKLLGCRVHLFLHVKVRKDWQENQALLGEIGLLPAKHS